MVKFNPCLEQLRLGNDSDMKVRLYAGDINLNKKKLKKVGRNTKKIFFRKQNGENAFLVQLFYRSLRY